MNLSNQIKDKASELGFAKTGIAAADALDAEAANLHQWLTRGLNADMTWMEANLEKRTDPRVLFPGARSIVVVAQNYFTDHKHDEAEGRGKISRYAWGDDYHDVVHEKLKELLAWIKVIEPSADGKICVDTVPMMDKAWAVRAGIGWLGKHSNVITTEIGSWIFIGSIILNIDLEYGQETVVDHCGTCTACLDACPTSAIIEPYIVDSKKCISYATIELRGESLPREIAEHQDGWLYGCDICQDVCPWNRFEKQTDETRFEPRENETSLVLDSVITMTHDEYVERFRRSAMKRSKLGGLKRNARSIKNNLSGDI